MVTNDNDRASGRVTARAVGGMATWSEAKVQFGDWTLWEQRQDLARSLGGRRGGLYLWACSAGRRPERATPTKLPREVIYVGDAKDLSRRPLSGRHHRLDRYAKLTGDTKYEALHVAVAPLYETGCDDYSRWRIYTLYLEAMLFWEYTRQHGVPPLLRFKEGGEGNDWIRAESDRVRARLVKRGRR